MPPSAAFCLRTIKLELKLSTEREGKGLAFQEIVGLINFKYARRETFFRLTGVLCSLFFHT